MVVDTSAIVAILQREPEADVFLDCLQNAPRRLIAGPTYLEASIVVSSRRGVAALDALNELLGVMGADIVPFTSVHAQLAVQAFLRFGKGQGSAAQLNFGDCVSYALAIATGLPLLFNGRDFRATDVQPAIAP